ncbi:MAG: mechanosensitive ion channel [Hydrococcus sp. C42_A2020_068]|nr:mechanosensitive ion channel [Hydrococcus sp. C42_A2020_068]
MTYLTGFIAPKLILMPIILAQISGQNQQPLPLNAQISQILGQDVFTLIKAILILIVGWVVALIARGITRKLLNRTQIDNQIANWIGGRQQGESLPVEKWVGDLVFWLILLFAIVAFLNALQLEAVSQPLNSLLARITSFLPQLLGAVILLGIAWILATITKFVVVRILTGLRIDERLNQQIGDETQQNQIALSETIANALYWFIFLLFLPSILSALNLEGTLVPIQSLLNEILAILPNVLAAILIGAVGWLIAQIVRRVVTNLLAAVGTDRVGERFGLSATAGRQPLSQILGTIVYVLILIPVAITALDALQIQAISAPATQMLNQVLNLLPRLFAAAVVLALAYVGGRYIAEIVTNILTSIGFNNVFQWLGLAALSPPPPEPGVEVVPPQRRTPSELVGIIVLVAIMAIATLTAVDILQIQVLQALVGGLLVIAGQVLVAVVVFAIGLYLANLAFNLIASGGTRQARFVAQTARISIVVLVSAMALQQMGIAPNIVNLAFGILVGGIAAAIALAFGLGGRELASEQLREWLNNFKQ